MQLLSQQLISNDRSVRKQASTAESQTCSLHASPSVEARAKFAIGRDDTVTLNNKTIATTMRTLNVIIIEYSRVHQVACQTPPTCSRGKKSTLLYSPPLAEKCLEFPRPAAISGNPQSRLGLLLFGKTTAPARWLAGPCPFRHFHFAVAWPILVTRTDRSPTPPATPEVMKRCRASRAPCFI